MTELRKILDLFEGAGFTVTYCLAPIQSFPIFGSTPKEVRRPSNCFEVALKSCANDNPKQETARTSDVISLAENAGYYVTYFNKDDYVTYCNYGGTMLIHLAPPKESSTQ
jgi:hypothetical protein